ncbi:hypothetical protein AKJ56_00895 [candidate division MSBL1 archaeon SCGC-AAA382N08]|uniref:mevalonate kinase n=1 Tax=candidate division MSBL1 archaeon SCGC-AAA382N08 TaxID=1698285 RepID=A0A133VQ92_9EURY|nr:hypothetical protein AKJ56_00895 [candidate division MSBL1 archaeon SCGC-AAA382N08]
MKASSPGQIFLFGEHAVVYGQPALLASIGLRTIVEAEVSDNSSFTVKSEKVGEMKSTVDKTNGEWKIKNSSGDVDALRYVVKVAELVFNYCDFGTGVSLSISSDLPLGAGLGSSSAVTTATAAAISTALGKDLDKDEIADLSYKAETEIQGAASRAGVSVATYGGFLRIQDRGLKSLKKLSNLEILIGYSGEYGDTGKMVNKVRNLRESSPSIYDPIIKTIGKATEAGIEALKRKNLKKTCVLMNANQSLLEGLRVSSPKLQKLIESSRDSGASGIKITGSGGGGCIIVVGIEDFESTADAIKESGGIPIRTEIGLEGLKY